MQNVSINDLKPGMILAKNVYGRNENVLMGKGVAISSDSIEQLSSLGIESLFVESPDEKKDLNNEEIEKITKEVEEMLNSQFEKVSHNPIMKELKRVFANYLIKKRTS